ncbi:MAG: septum formation initiator family protein [Candidatus Aerophobetes bacterium]|nr:septum formation initiator family protein [Candidatus Aerophobetes bacterium]
MKYLISIFIFIFFLIGIQIYKSTELMRISYKVQKLQSQIENLKKENGALKRSISSSLSLRRLEGYARKNLNLAEPREVRFIKTEPPIEEKKSFSPFLKKGSLIRKLINSILRTLNLSE